MRVTTRNIKALLLPLAKEYLKAHAPPHLDGLRKARVHREMCSVIAGYLSGVVFDNLACLYDDTRVIKLRMEITVLTRDMTDRLDETIGFVPFVEHSESYFDYMAERLSSKMMKSARKIIPMKKREWNQVDYFIEEAVRRKSIKVLKAKEFKMHVEHLLFFERERGYDEGILCKDMKREEKT